jgi:hypothetical protein
LPPILNHHFEILPAMFHGEPATVLRALGYFGDGNVEELGERDRIELRQARSSVRTLPPVTHIPGSLAPPSS